MWREVLPALGDDVELTLALVALINRDQKPGYDGRVCDFEAGFSAGCGTCQLRRIRCPRPALR